MNEYQILLEKIEEKEREIVHLECEVEDCREHLRMLQLELECMEEEK